MIRRAFFRRDPLTCARELVGTELVWGQCSGVIVEVEAYAAVNDEAAHTFTRPSAINQARPMSISITAFIGC
jgi:DNA-3-methyladenine glycosylase